MDKYTKNQQTFIDGVGEDSPLVNVGLAIIGKQDMTIALLLGALKMARLSLERGQNISGHIAATGPMTIGNVIDNAIADAEKGGMRVVDSSQLVEVLLEIHKQLTLNTGWDGGDKWADKLLQQINSVLGAKEGDGMMQPNTEYQTIVYY